MSKQDGRSRVVSAADADDSGTPILHIDMDAFFASVSLLDRPEDAHRPVAIGHRTGRSVVSTANYAARRYGVGAAMPMARALQLCPSLLVIEPDFAAYQHYSSIVMNIFRDTTPLVEVLGIDEAFLDVSGARRLLGSPAQIGQQIRRRVRDQTGLACTVGIAATKFVAKIASGKGKPDGLLVIPRDETVQFLRPLPIRALWGVGAKTAESLERIALHTIGDVADAPERQLVRAVGPAAALKLSQLSRGYDPRRVEASSAAEKSIGHEVTFEYDVTDEHALRRELLGLSDRVASRLRAADLSARTVALKVRYSDFSTLSRSRTLAEPTRVARRIYEESVELLASLESRGRPVRLIGVRAEGLQAGVVPEAALWDPDEEWREAENTIDTLRGKFGTAAIGPASLLRKNPRVPPTPPDGGLSERGPAR
ncbi:DNA polymerase IV [Mycetocola spongiae]|uniref:DNA polymerase IV n=1 Tax=Mycetocola spongiae TaxID=2859226 RepID=UPI001CF18E22|nr:DNA polymerase IV [Mycetocola spongiae]UCR89289.1 DNA polymerase IV [Mycetocola spongiae]